MSGRKRSALLAAAVVAGVGMAAPLVRGDVLTWNSVASGSWQASGAWAGADWVDGSTAMFNAATGSAGTCTLTLSVPVAAAGIDVELGVFRATGTNTTTLTLSTGGLVINGTGNTSGFTINAPLVLAGAAQTWTNKASSFLTVLGATDFGTGTLTLTQGNIQFANATNVGSAPIVIAGTAATTLQAGADNPFGAGTIYFRSNSRISSNGTTARSVSNPLSVDAGTSWGGQNNTGTLTLTGPVTIAGNFQITSDCGGTGTLNKSQTVIINGPTTLKGNLTLFTQANSVNSNTTIFNGTIGDDSAAGGAARNLTKSGGNGTGSGGGLLQLTGTNTYTGNTTVSVGTLALASTDLTNNIAKSPRIQLSTGTTALDVTGIASGFSVAPGQLLTGVGTVYGGATVPAGASLAPGVSTAGSIAFHNDLTLAGGTVFYDQNDLINVTGNLGFLDGTTTVLQFNNVASLTAGTYRVANYGGALAGIGSITTNVPAGSRINPQFDFSTTGQVNLTISGPAATLVWAGDGSGNAWDLNGTPNWFNAGTPDKFFNFDAVTFDDTSSNTTVNLTAGQVVQPRSITVNGAQSYTIQGAGQIAGTTSLVDNSTGTLTLATANAHSGGTSVNAGQLLVANADALGTGSVTIGATAKVALAAALPKAVKTPAVNIAAGGVLDLADGKLAIDYTGASPLATVRSQVISGYNAGSWNGAGIVSSSAPLGFNGHATGVGYAEASQALGATGGTFAGQSVDGSTVLLRYTLSGDSNLDGKVDLTDFTFLAANFNATGAGWLQGDYNYDGNVDLTDFTFLASNFNQSLAAGGGSPGEFGAPVPEPTATAALALGSLLIRRRRRA